MLIAYKYRIYPSNEQSIKIESWINECRKLYNYFLSERKKDYTNVKNGTQETPTLNYYSQKRELPILKKDNLKLKNIHSQVLQDVVLRLDRAFKNFFRELKNPNSKVGYPRFKGVGRCNSFMFGNSGYKLISKDKLKLSKIGEVKIKLHRDLPDDAKLKTCTIVAKNGKYFAIFALETKNPNFKTSKNRKNLIELSTDLTNPKEALTSKQIDISKFKELQIFKQTQMKLHKKLVKKVSELKRKNPKSNRTKKFKKEISNIRIKITNSRADFFHKLTFKLTDGYKKISIQSLNLQKLNTNAKDSVNSMCSIFKDTLSYKAERAGSELLILKPIDSC